MTRQSSLMVVAEIRSEEIAGLQSVLNKMNSAPGQADPNNLLVPFGALETLHFARFVILHDQTLEDVQLLCGRPTVRYPVYLCLMCDFDGGKEEFLSRLVEVSDSGLREVFFFCRGFETNCDLSKWLRGHDQPIAAGYVNWRGRTVIQSLQERALRLSLDRFLRRQPNALHPMSAAMLWQKAREFKIAEESAGRLAPLVPASLSQKMAQLFYALWSAALLIAFLVPYLLLVAIFVRRQEKTDPSYYPESTDGHSDELSVLEDWQFTNQFTVLGSLKPSLAWRLAMTYAFAAIDFAAKFFYVRGGLARIRTIHAARWVFLDDRRRVVFASNYDGSLESYMDDFIDKAYFGLNLAFGGAIGYPTTKWILMDGAWDEQKFKQVLRRHQVPTQVWYDAYPNVTAVELERNGRIREALEQETITEDAAGKWLQLL